MPDYESGGRGFESLRARHLKAAALPCRPVPAWKPPLSLFVALCAVILMLVNGDRPVLASQSASIIGKVESQDGTPIFGATVRLRGTALAREAISDGAGSFHLEALRAGEYSVSAFAHGFAPLAGRTVNIAEDQQSSIVLVLFPVQASSLAVLGRVTVNGGETLSTAPAPILDINAPAYAAQGVTRASDTLGTALSTTVVPVIGGGFNAPAAVALRGPDPSETLVAVDGHQVNNGNTGDYDLSLLDPADLQNIQVVYGIAPSSLVGPDTLGGAINIRTLEPTSSSHGLMRLTFGSYGTTGQTIQATGSDDRIGYALSYHRLTSAGELSNYPVMDESGDESVVGNGLDATSTLAKARYAFDKGAGFIALTFRDQAAYRDVSATLTSLTGQDAAGSALYDSFAGSAVPSHNAAYGVDVQFPVGPVDSSGLADTTALFRHMTSLVSQSVEGPAIGTSPYLFSGRDAIDDDSLELSHPLPDGSLALKLAFTTESLNTDYSPNTASNDDVWHRAVPQAILSQTASGGDQGDSDSGILAIRLTQTQRSLGLRYALDPTTKLHYSLAVFYSDYSSFGRSFDPRFGFVWTPSAESAIRFSVGSTFQSPQLPSLLVPSPLPPPVNGYVSVGNPNLSAERSTEYDLGFEHLFSTGAQQSRLGVDAYRTNIRNGIATFFPQKTCTTQPSTACLSYPINVDAAVYTGLELQGDTHLGPRASLAATYGVDSVYTQSFPASTQDGTIVAHEQILGVPLHKATLTLSGAPSAKLDYYAGVLYEGSDNELNRGPFATLRAGITTHLHGFDVGLYGTNLTNVYDDKFTVANGGVPYGGPDGPLRTDAFALPGRTIAAALTKRF